MFWCLLLLLLLLLLSYLLTFCSVCVSCIHYLSVKKLIKASKLQKNNFRVAWQRAGQ